MCVSISNHISQFLFLAYIVMDLHLLQVVVFLCTLLYSTCRVQQYSIFVSSPRYLKASVKAVLMQIILLRRDSQVREWKGNFLHLRRHCQFLSYRARMQKGTQRLQMLFRMQSSATMSSIMHYYPDLLPRHNWIIISGGTYN